MNAIIRESTTLIRKEILLEWRQLFAFNGVVLYLVSTVFVCFLSFEGIISTQNWNSLFWIILLFASLNAVLKSFIQEREGRILYYYSLANAQSIILAKMIYNALLMLVLSFVGLLIFIGFMGNPILNMALFTINMVLGVIGFSSVLTMVSAIASKARNNFTLMGVLSFPLILPLLLVLIKISSSSLSGGTIFEQAGNILVLFLITAITFVLSNILFPYIWTD